MSMLELEIKEFGVSKSSEGEATYACCRIYVKSVNRCGLKAEKAYAAAYPEVSQAAWRRYAAMGRGQVCREMGLGTFPARKCLERLTVARQRRLLLEGPMVYYKHGELRRVPAMKMNTLLVSQVFTRNVKGPLKIRGLEAQEKWRSSYDETKKESSEPYNVRNGRLCTHDAKGRPIFMDVALLEGTILPAMKSQIRAGA